MKIAHIVLGAPLEEENVRLKKTEVENIYVGVDRGALYLLNEGVPPTLSIGDFDSVSKEEFALVNEESLELKKFSSDKDDTDAELAIEFTEKMFKPDYYIFYNWRGGRLDHSISVLFLVHQPRFADLINKFIFLDAENILTFYKAGKYNIKKEKGKKYLSIVGLTPLKKLSVKNVKYPLEEIDYTYPRALVSNEFIEEEAQFSFEEGIVAIIQTAD